VVAANYSYIKNMTYIYTLKPEVMDRLRNLTRTIQNFIKNCETVINKLRDCTFHCGSCDDRYTICKSLDDILEKFVDHIDFLMEIVSTPVSDAIDSYHFELIADEYKRVEELKTSISSFQNLAPHAVIWLRRCNFMSDNNCSVSENEQSIISFFEAKTIEFKEYRTALEVFGSNSKA
jgi:hypothetical protein